MSTPFRTGRMPVRKARPRLTDLPGRMPGKRQAGWPFSLVIFLFGYLSLWPRKEKVTRAPKAHESSCFHESQGSWQTESEFALELPANFNPFASALLTYQERQTIIV